MPAPHSEPFTLFTLVWAVAALLHIHWPAVFLPGSIFTPAPPPLLIALALATVAVIIRPTSVWRLLALAAVQVADVVYHLPFVSNHWLLHKLLIFRPLGPPAAGLCDWQGDTGPPRLTPPAEVEAA